MRSSPASLLVALAVAGCGSHPPAVTTAPPAPTATPTPVASALIVDAAAPLIDPEPPALRLPDDVVPTGYRVRLDLDPEQDRFTGHVDIDVTVARAVDHVWLNSTGLTITAPSYTAAGSDRPLTALPRHTDDVIGFGFGATVAPGPATLHLDFGGALAGDDMAGLFRQEDHGKHYLFSQLEPVFARKAIPSFDEPRWKTRWQITLVVPAGLRAFSNTPEDHVTARPDGRQEIGFAPTPPMPSYLLAVAVGPFEVVDGGTVGRNQVPSRIIVPAGRGGEATAVIATTRRAVDALEAYFDIPLPLAKLDQLALPVFFGGMENPGLITYSADRILADKDHDTKRFQRGLVGLVGHELAHQWFGDLVTLAWWDDTWLNEAFATWMADKVAAAIDPDWDAAAGSLGETSKAMAADLASAAPPLRHPIKTTGDIMPAFDEISYQKGGAVLSMFERWIGADKFRDGVRAYLRAHAEGTATSADFQAAIASIAPEVNAAFASFLEQPGVPLVDVGLRCEAGAPPVITLHQVALAAAGTTPPPTRWQIPVCVRTGTGKRITEACTLLADETAQLPLTGACPTLVVANAGAAGYYRVRYQGALGTSLLKHLEALAPAERLAFADDSGALVASGLADPATAFELTGLLLKAGDEHSIDAALGLLHDTMPLIDDGHRPAWRRWLVAQLGARARKAGFEGGRAETQPQGSQRRSLLVLDGIHGGDPVLAAQARKLALGWLSEKRTIRNDDLSVTLWVAARHGDAALYDAMIARIDKLPAGPDRTAVLHALGAFPTPALVERSLQLFLDRDFGLEEVGVIIEGVFGSPDTQPTGWAFLQGHFDAFLAKLPPMIRGYIAMAVEGFCDPTLRQQAAEFLTPRVKGLSYGDYALGKALATIDRCVALRASTSAAIATYFAK